MEQPAKTKCVDIDARGNRRPPTGAFKHESVSDASAQRGWLGTPDRLSSHQGVSPVSFAGNVPLDRRSRVPT
jgi:hypothetical protein